MRERSKILRGEKAMSFYKDLDKTNETVEPVGTIDRCYIEDPITLEELNKVLTNASIISYSNNRIKKLYEEAGPEQIAYSISSYDNYGSTSYSIDIFIRRPLTEKEIKKKREADKIKKLPIEKQRELNRKKQVKRLKAELARLEKNENL